MKKHVRISNKVNKKTYWPGTYNKEFVQKTIEPWPQSNNISLYVTNKKQHNKAKQPVALLPVVLDKTVWSLRCDICFKAYASKEQLELVSKAQRPDRRTLESWASATGCATRKKEKWERHINSPCHTNIVERPARDADQNGIVQRSISATDRITNAVRCLFRMLLYVAQQRRPLSDVNCLRQLHALDGMTDLSLDPTRGALADPSANYSSEQVVQEMLEIATDVCNEETSELLKHCHVFDFTLDESCDNGNLPQLLVYAHMLASLPHDKELKAPVFRLLACKQLRSNPEAAVAFAREILQLDGKLLSDYEKPGGVALKGGLNMLLAVHETCIAPRFRGELRPAKCGGGSADSTASNSGEYKGFFALLFRYVKHCGNPNNPNNPNKVAV